ncbi:MAG: HNH endonuclease [Pyrinomonadaceae bacterium]
MNCTRGRANPDAHTKLRLFADSAGYCQNPDCTRELFEEIGDSKIHLAEMAHIFSAVDGGPRTNPDLSNEERKNFANLILLCSICHTRIDKAEDEFPDSLIRQWKQQHGDRIKELFQVQEFSTRTEARRWLTPLLQENKTIFDIYGPKANEASNPESSLPQQWERKIRKTLLPNNRRILAVVDSNRHLLTEEESSVYDIYRQHVDDFESKHIGISEVSGVLFPADFVKTFSDDN